MSHIRIEKGVSTEYGASLSEAGINFCFTSSCSRTLFLCLYDKNDRLIEKIDMLPYRTFGNVYSVKVSGLVPEEISYTFEADGKLSTDIYAKNAKRNRKWGESRKDGKINPYMVYNDTFDWKGDKLLETDLCEVIAYDLHVRGFTKDPSSKVKYKGTYLGLTEKISHLKDMSVNQVILMPAYDFDETEDTSDKPYHREDVREKINYWGFKSACYFMPKPEYSYSDDFVNEFKNMVLALHREGIEVVMRFYFPDEVNRNIIIPCLKHWVSEYHIDGFFMMGENIPIDMICKEAMLSHTKIYYKSFDTERLFGGRDGFKHSFLAKADSDCMNVYRRYLKSDEDMLQRFTELNRSNPADIRQLNYITTYEGFTLNDLVSYDYKHNDDNNENNLDGTDYNYSWNCGQEGMSRKKAVRTLRLKQMKNAVMMLMFSRGIPVILSGDEFMNTRNGNNNPYCQDNAISWIKWKKSRETELFESFVKSVIRLRTAHPILHMCHEPKLIDTLSCGYPDLSYHAEAAWYPKFYNHIRNIGMMYCGMYAKREDGKDDDFFYIAYNMHWEEHSYALPKLPEGLKWRALVSSDGNIEAYTDKLSEVKDSIVVKERAILLLISEKDKDSIKKQKKKITEE
ncbi:MAG: hypothetical protein K6G22_15470 [Lachnospiraceae bacterium]|nr:hypothetical protein [Lachnospiraceae bacterium]